MGRQATPSQCRSPQVRIPPGASDARSPSALDLENRFDLDRDIAGKRPHPDGATSPYAGFFAEDVSEQFAAPVDHRRMMLEIGRTVDHAQHLDHTHNTVE